MTQFALEGPREAIAFFERPTVELDPQFGSAHRSSANVYVR